MEDDIVIAVDKHSFPKHCDALETLLSIVKCNFVEIQTESPREFLNRCEELCGDYDLVIPCTRNLFIRDHLLNRGVNLIITV